MWSSAWSWEAHIKNITFLKSTFAAAVHIIHINHICCCRPHYPHYPHKTHNNDGPIPLRRPPVVHIIKNRPLPLGRTEVFPQKMRPLDFRFLLILVRGCGLICLFLSNQHHILQLQIDKNAMAGTAPHCDALVYRYILR